MMKVRGSSNVADTTTKNVRREVQERSIDGTGGVFLDRRAEKAAQIHSVARGVRQLRFTMNNSRKRKEVNNIYEPKENNFIDVVLIGIENCVCNLELTKRGASRTITTI